MAHRQIASKHDFAPRENVLMPWYVYFNFLYSSHDKYVVLSQYLYKPFYLRAKLEYKHMFRLSSGVEIKSRIMKMNSLLKLFCHSSSIKKPLRLLEWNACVICDDVMYVAWQKPESSEISYIMKKLRRVIWRGMACMRASVHIAWRYMRKISYVNERECMSISKFASERGTIAIVGEREENPPRGKCNEPCRALSRKSLSGNSGVCSLGIVW